jgi:hypothetical protein
MKFSVMTTMVLRNDHRYVRADRPGARTGGGTDRARPRRHIRADAIGRESGPPNAVLAHENRRVSLMQQVTGITPTAPLGHNVAASYISFD